MFKPQRSTLSEVVKTLGVTGESNRFWVRTPSPLAGLTHPTHTRAYLPLQAEARKSRLFGGCFVVVHSLGARTQEHHVWWAIVESMRTWIIERNFQIPLLYVDDDEHLERRRRAGVLKRGARAQDRPAQLGHGSGKPHREVEVRIAPARKAAISWPHGTLVLSNDSPGELDSSPRVEA